MERLRGIQVRVVKTNRRTETNRSRTLRERGTWREHRDRRNIAAENTCVNGHVAETSQHDIVTARISRICTMLTKPRNKDDNVARYSSLPVHLGGQGGEQKRIVAAHSVSQERWALPLDRRPRQKRLECTYDRNKSPQQAVAHHAQKNIQTKHHHRLTKRPNKDDSVERHRGIQVRVVRTNRRTETNRSRTSRERGTLREHRDRRNITAENTDVNAHIAATRPA